MAKQYNSKNTRTKCLKMTWMNKVHEEKNEKTNSIEEDKEF